MHVRKNDIIQVTAGDDAGKTGRILNVMTKQNRVIVEGINYIQKHIKRSEKNPEGGRIQKEAPISVSNVLLICQIKIVRRMVRVYEPEVRSLKMVIRLEYAINVEVK